MVLPSLDKITRPRGSVDSTLQSAHRTVTDPDFPEGGIEAWCTVFGAFLAHFCGYGYTSSFCVYQAFYTRHYLQNESPSAISWIGSLATFLVTAMGPISGQLFDKGYFYHVYITGAILVSFSIFMLSLVQPGKFYQVLLVQGLTLGIGQGLLFVPSLALLSHHFKHRRTAMLSIVASGTSLGSICHTIMLNKLLNGPLGFKTGVRVSATFVTVLLFLSCALVRTRYSAVHREPPSVNTWKVMIKCFTEIPSLLTIIGFMCFYVAYAYPYIYFEIDSLKHGLGASFAFYSVAIISAGGFVGRVTAGAFASFIGIIDLTIITNTVCAILIIGTIWIGSAASVVVLGVLYGLFSGLHVALMPPTLMLTLDPAELGVRLGVSSAIISIGGLIGPPICGALLTRHFHWWRSALFCGAIILVGGISFMGVRFSFAHWQARARATAAQRCMSDKGEEEFGSESEVKDHASLYP